MLKIILLRLQVKALPLLLPTHQMLLLKNNSTKRSTRKEAVVGRVNMATEEIETLSSRKLHLISSSRRMISNLSTKPTLMLRT